MKNKIYTFDNDQPHPDYNGWENFLKNHCEIRDKYKGVIYYGSVNCNYILFPCGLLIRNYGYHGKALMNKIREKGPNFIKNEFLAFRRELKQLLAT